MIVDRLDRIENKVEAVQEETRRIYEKVADNEKELAVQKVKASGYGAITGVIGGFIAAWTRGH